MWRSIKRLAKQNVRNPLLKNLAHFGKAVNRLYENRNYDIHSNGEKNLLENLSKLNARCIVDVGANNGDYAAIAKEIIPEATIHCFEPASGLISQLRERFQGDSNIHIHPTGLHHSSGEATLNQYGHHQHSSMLSFEAMSREVKGEESIKVIKGDDFILDNHIDKIDLLKIDVEGVEFEVIQGFDQAFTHKKIRTCQFEYGYANIISRNLLIDFYEYFEKRGYIVGKIYPKGIGFRPYHVRQEDFLGPNYFAVLEDEFELINQLGK